MNRAYPYMQGVPAAGHIRGGFWHPGPIDGCAKCPAPAPAWRPGEPVTVVEYGRDRAPRPGGLTFPARVTHTAGLFVLIAYDDPGPPGRQRDQFYAESGWRAMDGELRWKLHRQDGGGRRGPRRA